ncbi:MAG: hypothetical protein WAQ28_07885 [Bacteroidia bacterium]|jgi:hypothetical protein
MKKQIPARSRQTSSASTSQTLPLLMVISILAVVFITVFQTV